MARMKAAMSSSDVGRRQQWTRVGADVSSAASSDVEVHRERAPSITLRRSSSVLEVVVED